MILRAFLCSLLLTVTAAAQVPHLIDYQGKITVSGNNFDGQGQFKFALVNPGGGTNYWSNDGTTGVPATHVTVTVTDGLYSVILGEAPMQAITPSALDHPDVRLRIWFNDGTNGFQHLTPDRRIAAVGYALMADSVPDGSITSAKLAPGLAASLGSGNMAASLSASDATLLGNGYIKLQTINAPEWQTPPASDAPNIRTHHTAVWTDTDMIVWGGKVGTALSNQGGIYNPGTKLWSPTPVSSVSPARSHHTAVWADDRMIVWGGFTVSGETNTGAIFTQANLDTSPPVGGWLATSLTSAPTPRSGHSAVWTETEMLIWGGKNSGGALGDGGRFTPGTNTWSDIPASVARHQHTAVWTGSKMIIWGGLDDGFQPLATGGIYNPLANTWAATPAADTPTGRTRHSAVWTGTQMIIFGGASTEIPGSGDILADGAAYDPDANSWTPLAAAAPRHGHGAVWTGSEMIVFGGGQPKPAAYNPATNTWRDLPAGDFGSTGVWSGSELLVFGGSGLKTLIPSPAYHLYGKF